MEVTGPLTFWSVAVILTVTLLALILVFLVLTDFCCELRQCGDAVLPPSAGVFYQSLLDVRWSSSSSSSSTTSSRGDGTGDDGEKEPSAPPLEETIANKDTEVTIEVEGQYQWASYFNFCRTLREDRHEPVISVYSGNREALMSSGTGAAGEGEERELTAPHFEQNTHPL